MPSSLDLHDRYNIESHDFYIQYNVNTPFDWAGVELESTQVELAGDMGT